MIISAGLTQITPKAIGWLADDILTQSEIAFKKVIPFLILILIVDVVNDVCYTNWNIYCFQTNK